jgi:hypothetical protein
MIIEIGHFRDVRDGEVAQEEGALPVEVTGIGSLGTVLQSFACKFQEAFLTAFLVVILCQPLHLIQRLRRYAMVENLHKELYMDSHFVE